MTGIFLRVCEWVCVCVCTFVSACVCESVYENERGNENGNENGKGRQNCTFYGMGRRSCVLASTVWISTFLTCTRLPQSTSIIMLAEVMACFFSIISQHSNLITSYTEQWWVIYAPRSLPLYIHCVIIDICNVSLFSMHTMSCRQSGFVSWPFWFWLASEEGQVHDSSPQHRFDDSE